MKIVLYTEDYLVLNVFEDVQNPKVEINTVEWDNGRLRGIKVPFLLLEDEVEVGQTVTGLLDLDKKAQFTKVDIDLEQEYKQLKKQQADLMFELMTKRVI